MIISTYDSPKVQKAKAFCKKWGYTFNYDCGEYFSYSFMGTTATFAYYLIP